MFWNAQSITSISKQLQLELILSTLNIDIILIAETFLKPQNNINLNSYIFLQEW